MSKTDLTDPTVRMCIFKSLEIKFNEEMRAGTYNTHSYMGLLGLINHLTELMPATILGIGAGAYMHKDLAYEGTNIWLGIGPIKPETGYYDTVVSLHICNGDVETAVFFPAFICRIKRPETIAIIKQTIEESRKGLRVVYRKTETPDEAGKVEEISDAEADIIEQTPSAEEFAQYMNKLTKEGKVN